MVRKELGSAKKTSRRRRRKEGYSYSARIRLVKTQQAGKSLARAVLNCKLWTLATVL
jgi:hypothetical protein